jgi:MtaA/CmuA family methyltransferase
MKTKIQLFHDLLRGGDIHGKTLFYPILMHFAARFNHTTYGALASDYKVLVASNIMAMEHFDLDMVSLISDPYRETSAFGAKIEFLDEGVPKCKNILVHSLEDAKALCKPDLYTCDRTLDRIKGARLYQEILKGEVPVIGWIEGPLAEACTLAGVSEMLMKLMMDPDFCNYLMDVSMLTAREFARAQVEEGCQVIGIGDAICSQIDIESYNKYVLDRHRELIEYIHSLGAYVKLHICGDITHLLPSIARLGADIVDFDWQVDLEQGFNLFQETTIRCGNINPVNIQNKTIKEVFEESLSLVNAEKGRKFMLSGGCEITPDTSPENLMAMRSASYLE